MSTYGPLIPDKLHLLRVDIVKGLIENPLELKEDQIDGYEFGMGYFSGFNLEEQLVKTELEINISTRSSSECPKAKGLFRLAFHFKIENFNDLVQQKKDGLEVSSALGNALASISYSTSRGILLTRFQGTILKDFILPVIDPNILLEPKNNIQAQAKK